MITKMLQISLIQRFLIFIYLLSIPSGVTRHSRTLIDNIFYNKPMLNITAGNISTVILNHLIQSLIMQNPKKHLQRYYINFDQIKFKNGLNKIN